MEQDNDPTHSIQSENLQLIHTESEVSLFEQDQIEVLHDQEVEIDQLDSLQNLHPMYYGVFLALFYLSVMSMVGDITYKQVFFVVLILLLFIDKEREFLNFWGPFLLLWLVYDLEGFLIEIIDLRVDVYGIYTAEIWLTGWFTDNRVLAFILQEFKTNNAGSKLILFLDLLTSFFYLTHLIAPVALGAGVYFKNKYDREFKRFTLAFILLSLAGFISHIVYPVAPPWYVWNGGDLIFDVPGSRTGIKSAAGLENVDEFLGYPFFEVAYSSFNSNAYAAFPSMHFAYSLIVPIFAIRIYGKKAWITMIYPLGMAFSAVWLNHHYLIDILFGGIYVLLFSYLAIRFYNPPKK